MEKRMNRKKIIQRLEIARQGYSSIHMGAVINNDKILEMCCASHYNGLNKMIVELGGESYELPEYNKPAPPAEKEYQP